MERLRQLKNIIFSEKIGAVAMATAKRCLFWSKMGNAPAQKYSDCQV